MAKKTIHLFVETNIVTETHTHRTIRGVEQADHVIREDYVAVGIDEDGQTLISRICASDADARAFLKSDTARAAFENHHGKDIILVDEDLAKPSKKFKTAIGRVK